MEQSSLLHGVEHEPRPIHVQEYFSNDFKAQSPAEWFNLLGACEASGVST